MFDTVRAHQRILLAIVLLLILPAFVLFGVSGYDRMFGPSEEVAVVGGEKISRQSLDLAHRQQLDQLREMAGGQLDTALFDTPQARAQTLENLITQQALLVQARNERSGLMSTCVVVPDPGAFCRAGQCVVGSGRRGANIR